MTMRGAVGAAACALALLAVGCSDGGEADQVAVPPPSTSTSSAPSTIAPTTTTTAPSTTVAPSATTTTVPADPFAVPDDPADIDEAYVERVINEHNRIIGDALRIQLAGGDPKEIVDRYNAVFVPVIADELLTGVFQMTPEDLQGVADPPGDLISKVVELTQVSDVCVIAVANQDFRPVRIDELPPQDDIVLLRRAEVPGDQALNLTGWLSEGSVALEDAPKVQC